MEEDKFTKLEARCGEQQRAIDELERKLSIVTTLLDDVIQVERAHEAQTLLLKNGVSLELDEGDSDDEGGRRLKHFCCF
jgi:hypothetical protein